MLLAVGIPAVKWYGSEQGWTGMVLDRLGPSLEDLFTFCKRRFTLKTVLMIADQIVRTLNQMLLCRGGRTQCVVVAEAV